MRNPADSAAPGTGALKPFGRALVALALVISALAVSPLPASAHDLRPGALGLREASPGSYTVRLTPPQDGSGLPMRLTPTLPEHCAWQTQRVVCDGPLSGALAFPELADRRVKMVVFVRNLDGTTDEVILREGEHTAWLGEAASERPDTAKSSTFVFYLEMGIEHILGGIDHLFFVICLALIAVRPRRVAIAVTGFTLGHSVTLAASSLGLIYAPSGAVELVIAASIVLMAIEAIRQHRDEEQSLTSTWPWLIAAGFGLIHGFGFAGALAELGLPEGRVLPALLAFNLGVEFGQLAVLAAFGGVVWFVRRVAPAPIPGRLATAVGWTLGFAATWWTVERFTSWASGLV